MNKKIYIPFAYLSGFLFLILFSQCQGTKQLSANQHLYTGAEIKFKGNVYKKKQLLSQLDDVFKIEPNGTFLGMRPKLWIYQVTRDTSNNKGLDHWLNQKLGEPPVLLSDVDPSNVEDLLLNRMYNHGYFMADVNHEIEQKKKTASIDYLIDVVEAYRINEVFFPDSSLSEIETDIVETKERSYLTPGSPYILDSLIRERDRIDNYLKNRGYYYFSPNYLIFKADSTLGDRTLNLYLDVKEDVPPKALKKYYIEDIIVNPSFSLAADSSIRRVDTLQIKGISYILNTREFNPEVIINSIFLKTDSIYSREAYEMTLNRLMGLGVFQFVNIRVEELEEESNKLLIKIQLTPSKKKSIRFELQAVSKSNGYVGPGLNASFRNRNFLGGAELYVLQLNTGFETQLGNQQSGLNSYEFGVENNLYIPRFIVPFFNIRNRSSYFVPKTRIRLEYRHLNRLQFFKLNSLSASFGYQWNETISKQHRLNPISINYFQLSNTTGEFQEQLEESDYLRRSFEEQFILGADYSFTYQTPNRKDKKTSFYFNGLLDISGNLFYLLQSTLSESENGEYTIFNTPYSQYSKLTTEYRYYYNFGDYNKMAFRLLGGIGVPYGNSETLPFVKQFFIGGTNSIRAFGVRMLGPGTYRPENTGSVGNFYDQSGDIKLEANAEYRFTIYNLVKGALFLDAGNIWLLNPDESKPGAVFNGNNFYNEIAVGTGFGLRLDTDFFVIRLDLGVPLRKPWLPENDRWTFDTINFGSGEWRSENLVLNIAIGYPF